MRVRFWRTPLVPGRAADRSSDEPGLEYVSQPWTLRRHNRIELLRDGDQTFPAMLAAIRAARTHVHLETYILRSDRTGKSFQEALIERARAGVAVRLLYDAIGSLGTIHGDFLDVMRKEGIEVREFHPLLPWRPRWGLVRRDHQKILVVDDQVAFTGGINIGDEYCAEPAGEGWRDLHAQVEGQVVLDLARIFRRAWIRAGGEPFLEPPDPESAPAATSLRTLMRTIDNFRMRNRSRMHVAYRHAIAQANTSIRIMNAYFIPDRLLRRAFRLATQRGVSVQIIVPSKSDVQVVQWASRHLYGRLLRSGVRIFEYQERMMHAKVGTIDHTWSTIGSHNLDRRSLFHNLEVGLVVIDPEFAATLERQFDADLARSREVLLSEWLARSLWKRTLERVAFMLRYWL